jgi:small-conductance mechanosensitive channel
VLALFAGLGLLVAAALRRAGRARGRGDLGAVTGSVAKWAVWVGGLLLALTIVAPTLAPGDVIAGLGLTSLALGFALKEILQNLVAGVLILWRQPFRVGDQIAVEGDEGTVEHVEARATKIRTHDGRRVVVPNFDVYTRAVTVDTAFAARRSEARIGVALDADWGAALEAALGGVRRADGVLEDPAPDAQAVEVGEFRLVIRLRWWSRPERAEVIRAGSNALLGAQRALREAGVDIPAPVRVLRGEALAPPGGGT